MFTLPVGATNLFIKEPHINYNGIGMLRFLWNWIIQHGRGIIDMLFYYFYIRILGNQVINCPLKRIVDVLLLGVKDQNDAWIIVDYATIKYFAGSRITYYRKSSRDLEILTINGPTTEPLKIMVGDVDLRCFDFVCHPDVVDSFCFYWSTLNYLLVCLFVCLLI